MRRLPLLVLALLALACRPKPEHPIADSTNVGIDSTPDTMPDSIPPVAEVGDTGGGIVDTNGTLPDLPDSLLDSVLAAPRPRLMAAAGGLRYGLGNWPIEWWGRAPMTCTMLQVAPDNALKIVQALARSNMCAFIVPSRRYLTVSGETHSQFSMTRAKAATKLIYDKLPRDTTTKYVGNGTIRGMNLADDYGSTDQWGGKVVTQAEILEWATYARGLWGRTMPLGIRVEPSWIGRNDSLAAVLDYTWAQYRIPKGRTAQEYFDKNAAIAQRMNLKLVMGVNVHECNRAASPPCSAAQLRAFMSDAINHGYNCGSVSWRWDEVDWNSPGLRTVHGEMGQLAATKPNRSCARGADVASAR